MALPRGAALLAVAAGAALLGYAVLSGEARAGVVLVFPLVVGSGPASLAGVLLLFAGLALWMLGGGAPPARGGEATPASSELAPRRRARGGGVVLVGPVPILFASDRRAALLLALLMLALLALALALQLTR